MGRPNTWVKFPHPCTISRWYLCHACTNAIIIVSLVIAIIKRHRMLLLNSLFLQTLPKRASKCRQAELSSNRTKKLSCGASNVSMVGVNSCYKPMLIWCKPLVIRRGADLQFLWTLMFRCLLHRVCMSDICESSISLGTTRTDGYGMSPRQEVIIFEFNWRVFLCIAKTFHLKLYRFAKSTSQWRKARLSWKRRSATRTPPVRLRVEVICDITG